MTMNTKADLSRVANIAVDIGERVFLVLLFVTAFFRFGGPYHLQWDDIVFLTAEAFTVLLILVRRPGEMAMTPYPVLIALCGTALPLLTMAGGSGLIPETIGIGIMLLGLCISLSSKGALNRSFGLVAADRGIKTRWTYAVVRHPMYAGYIVTQAGFLLLHPVIWNWVILPLAWAFQVLRVFAEERFMMRSADYQRYADRVKYRLFPGLI